eukprot:5752-Eustigmatos_ZCMA.PRE.1
MPEPSRNCVIRRRPLTSGDSNLCSPKKVSSSFSLIITGIVAPYNPSKISGSSFSGMLSIRKMDHGDVTASEPAS